MLYVYSNVLVTVSRRIILACVSSTASTGRVNDHPEKRARVRPLPWRNMLYDPITEKKYIPSTYDALQYSLMPGSTHIFSTAVNHSRERARSVWRRTGKKRTIITGLSSHMHHLIFLNIIPSKLMSYLQARRHLLLLLILHEVTGYRSTSTARMIVYSSSVHTLSMSASSTKAAADREPAELPMMLCLSGSTLCSPWSSKHFATPKL